MTLLSVSIGNSKILFHCRLTCVTRLYSEANNEKVEISTEPRAPLAELEDIKVKKDKSKTKANEVYDDNFLCVILFTSYLKVKAWLGCNCRKVCDRSIDLEDVSLINAGVFVK
jgi:hypothetical protein